MQVSVHVQQTRCSCDKSTTGPNVPQQQSGAQKHLCMTPREWQCATTCTIVLIMAAAVFSLRHILASRCCNDLAYRTYHECVPSSELTLLLRGQAHV